MGGHDIFKTNFDEQKNEWNEPQNLGYPINTPDDDVYIISSSDSKRAYYSSIRDDGMGYTDIYMITIPDGLKKTEPTPVKEEPKKEEPKKEEVVKVEPKKEEPKKEEPKKEEPKKEEPKKEVVKVEPKKEEPKKEVKPIKYIVKIVDGKTKDPIDAKIKLQGLRDNVMVAMTNKGDGTYEFTITDKKAKDYRLSIEKDGYVFQNLTLKIDGAGDKDKTLNKTIELRKISVGVTSILHNLYFDVGRARFKTESYNELNKLETMMRSNENLMVEIAGHADNSGSTSLNLHLSQKRAEAVKDFLTKKGIDPRRIKAVGYGESKPLASNDDESEGRELNRRVEFKVLNN